METITIAQLVEFAKLDDMELGWKLGSKGRDYAI